MHHIVSSRAIVTHVQLSSRYDRSSVYDLLRLVAFTMEQEVLVGAQAGKQAATCCLSNTAADLICRAGGALSYFSASGRFPDLLIFTCHRAYFSRLCVQKVLVG